MLGAHAGDVVGERGGLALVGEGGLEAEELGELLLVGVVHGGALFQEDAELGVELVVGVGAGFGFFGEEFEEALRDDLVELLDEGAVLHRLAGDVEREVFAIDDALHEAEPLGEQVLGFGVDEDLAAVEGNGGLEAGHAEFLGVVLGDKEEGVDGERGVGAEVQAEAGLVVGVGLEFVELGVFLVLDLVLRAEPEGLDGVDMFVVKLDRERYEGAVALEDFLDLPVGGIVAAVVFELDDDLGTTAEIGDFLDLVTARTVAGPDVAGLAGAPRFRVNFDGLRDHERGIETDAELADEVGVLGAVLAEGLQELLGAGVGDGAEVFDELVARHADAVVLNRERLGLVVGGEADLELGLVVKNVLLGDLGVAEFFEGVGGVGHQLTDEDFLLRVEGVDDDIEQLLDLGLELEFLRCVGGHVDGLRDES